MRPFARSAKRLLKIVAGNVFVLGVLLALLEGVGSYGLFLRDLHDSLKPKALARQFYAKYDADLGWVNKANLDIADVYGPGGYVKTNAQGFRNDHNIEIKVPVGKGRIVCSGDSYTFGYGVDNAHTWCQLLTNLEPRLEAVNMGTDGYGSDQVFLRYKREAAAIDHQVHVFAFITEDFYRMLADSFLGYAKPLLEIENGKLAVKNVPVPVQKNDAGLAKLIEQSKNLRTFELVTRFRRRIQKSTMEQIPSASERSLTQREKDKKIRNLLRQIFSELKMIGQQRSIQLVLVYLPTIWELENRQLPVWSSHDEWSEFLKEESSKREILLIDLFENFQSLPHPDMVDMFIPLGKLPYPEGSFHPNERGHETIARVIYDKLMSEPHVGCVLALRFSQFSNQADGVAGHRPSGHCPAN